MTMIDKVARALEQEITKSNGNWKHAAKAAIEAMREPSERMIEAMDEDADMTLVWKAGIDAALKEE